MLFKTQPDMDDLRDSPGPSQLPGLLNSNGLPECASSGREGGVTLRDVKNEDRSGHVYENKGDDDKMSDALHAIYKGNA